jgi:hypothetical protein
MFQFHRGDELLGAMLGKAAFFLDTALVASFEADAAVGVCGRHDQ